jgi:hypothetical protein
MVAALALAFGMMHGRAYCLELGFSVIEIPPLLTVRLVRNSFIVGTTV